MKHFLLTFIKNIQRTQWLILVHNQIHQQKPLLL